MSSTRDDLLRAVRAEPEELAPRRVFADWLTQQGDPRGEFINAQCRLSERGLDPVTRRSLVARVHYMESEHGHEWAKSAHDMRARVTFKNGFVHTIAANVNKVLAHWESLLAVEPVVHVELTKASATSIRKVARSGLLGAVRHVTIRGHIGDKGVRSLASSPDIARVQRLNLTQVDMSDEGVLSLAAAEGFRPRRLSLTANEITDGGAQALAECQTMSDLECLYLSRTLIGDRGVRAIAESPHLDKLHTLTLGGLDELGDDGVRAIAKSPHLSALHYVEVNRCYEVSNSAVKALEKRVRRVRSDWA